MSAEPPCTVATRPRNISGRSTLAVTIPKPAQAITLSLPAVLPEPPAPLDSVDRRLQIANYMKHLIQPLNSTVPSVSDQLNTLENRVSRLEPAAPLLQASTMTAVHVTPAAPTPEVHMPNFTLASAAAPVPSFATGIHKYSLSLHSSDTTS
ncbi:UNVERIFIED_CONTAM: hypothetical protein FKN15_074605 [Acipenser sinensis]